MPTSGQGQRCRSDSQSANEPKGLSLSASTISQRRRSFEKQPRNTTSRPRQPSASRRGSQTSIPSDSAPKTLRRKDAASVCSSKYLPEADDPTTCWTTQALTDAALRRSEELLAGLDALGLTSDCKEKLKTPEGPLHESCNSMTTSPALWPDLDHTSTETAEVPLALLEILADTWVAASNAGTPTNANTYRTDANDSKSFLPQSPKVVAKKDQDCQYRFCIDEEEPISPSSRSNISCASTAASSPLHACHRACRQSICSESMITESEASPSLKTIACNSESMINESVPSQWKVVDGRQQLEQQVSLPTSASPAERPHINAEAFRIMSRLFHSGDGS